MRSIKQILLLSALVAIVASGSATAAIWTGLGDGSNWSDVANWDTPTYPDQYAEAEVAADGLLYYDVGGNFERSADTYISGNTNLVMNGKRFLNGRNAGCTFYISDNAHMTQSGDYFIIGTGHPASIVQTGGTIDASINRGFFVADSGNATGSSYNLLGGTLNAAFVASGDDWWNELLGRNQTQATFYVNGGDANFSVDTSMDRRIYIKGNSVLQIDSGSVTFDGFKWFSVGRDDVGMAEMIINGGTLDVITRNDGALVVGGQSTRGRITITSGILTVTSPQGLWVGDGANCIQGIVEQTGGDVVIEGGDVLLGREPSAATSYYQMDAGTLTARDLLLHENAATTVQFIFNGGLITLQGDKTAIVDEAWFVDGGGSLVEYDSVNDLTYISKIPYAHNPSPANGQTDVGQLVSGNQIDLTLSWETGLDTDPNGTLGQINPAITNHYLYVSSADPDDPNLYLVATLDAADTDYGNGTGEDLGLVDGTTYRWRVDESVNGSASTDPNSITGPLWSFTTAYAIPVISDITPVDAIYNPAETVQITCNYTSTTSAVTAVTWYLNDSPIDPDADSNISVVYSDTESTLTITSLSEAYEGIYYCVVSNNGGDSAPSANAKVEMRKLVAWYAFENDLTDSAGNNDGLAQGDPNFVAGKINQAIEFNGVDEAVEIPAVIEDDFTIELWVKTTATGGTGGWYSGLGLVDGEMNGNVNDFGTSLLGSKFGFGVGNPDVTISSTTDINDDQWHYCVATRDASTGEIRLYVDGERESTATGGTGAKDAPSGLQIGSILQDSNYLPGQIDEVKLYNYVQDDLTVATTYYGITGETVCVEEQRPEGKFDLNGDCIVDIVDFAEYATGWLDCGLYPDCQ